MTSLKAYQKTLQRFAERVPVSDREGDRLHAAAAVAEHARCTEDNAIATNHELRTMTADALLRQAVTGALSSTGVITIRSRRLRLSLPRYQV